ncbi:MAG: hypothetical protein ACM3ZQ_07495 [Bacillota bacterium]
MRRNRWLSPVAVFLLLILLVVFYQMNETGISRDAAYDLAQRAVPLPPDYRLSQAGLIQRYTINPYRHPTYLVHVVAMRGAQNPIGFDVVIDAKAGQVISVTSVNARVRGP